MNKSCKICDGHFDFRKLQIDYDGGVFGPDIAFNGHLFQCKQNNAFKFCPACGTPLTKENFGGVDIPHGETNYNEDF